MKKEIWLGIIHIRQWKAPALQDIINNEELSALLKVELAKVTLDNPVEKIVKTFANKHKKEYLTEQVFLSDSKEKRFLKDASFIFDVDNFKIIKSRYTKEENEKLITLYLERYKDKIEDFKKRFVKNE